jgi:hypothetical protein
MVEEEPRAKECRRFPETGKLKETDCPEELLEVMQCVDTLILPFRTHLRLLISRPIK